MMRKKTPENAFLKPNLSQNQTEKEFMPSKITVNLLFNDVCCYLVIACFD